MIFEGHRILEDLDVRWITQVFAPFKFVYARCLFFFSNFNVPLDLGTFLVSWIRSGVNRDDDGKPEH